MDQFLYLVLAFCVIASAFFSATETALVSIGRVQLRHIVKDGKPGSGFLQLLKKNQRRTIVTILIGNTIANISASAIASAIAFKIYGDVGVGIAAGVMTLILLIIGEIIPKSFSSANPETAALFLSPIMYYTMALLYPIIEFFDFFARLVPRGERRALSEKDIHAMVELGVEENVLEPGEQKMIERILKFNDTPVRDVMVSFRKVVSFDSDALVVDCTKTITKSGFSRFPVYSGDRGNIVGIVRAKDMVCGPGCEPGKRIADSMLPVLKIGEAELIDDVFRLFQRTHNHMAIVLDLYGKATGLVTMEDLLEEIVGEFESDGAHEFAGHA